ncbi:MAG TPA: RNA polymerase sigma factor RpoH [Gammaproteobacteria bacterium]|nr:RNA polymerase sigma factor RpoH [Gammaproteobacteria bacterium]
MANALELQPIPTAGSLEAYVQWANRIPLLSAEDERALASRYRRENHLPSARQLVLSHVRFVVKVARGYLGYGLPLADLIQEGTIGLMKAVRRFDPAIGVRLVSFAVHWIKAEIHEYIIRNWRIVKIATTKAQRKLFFNLRNVRRRLGWMGRDEVAEVASELGVSAREVEQMEARMNAYDASFDVLPEGEESGVVSPANYLEDLRFEPQAQLAEDEAGQVRLDTLNTAMESLDARSRDIITRRWLAADESKATLHELASKHGVSAERVRQIEKHALGKLRLAIGNSELPPAPI